MKSNLLDIKIDKDIPPEMQARIMEIMTKSGNCLTADAVLILLLERMCAWHVMIGDLDAAESIAKTIMNAIPKAPDDFTKLDLVFPTTKDLS